MKFVASCALCFCAAAALAACAGGGTSAPASARLPFVGLHVPAIHPDLRPSWRSPKLDLNQNGMHELFVSDFGNGDVYIFAIPAMTLLATLTGFDEPQGMCSDTSGDVWIANTATSEIFEYNHSGTLVNTLTDPTGYPVGCAWQKSTGNLAVTNIYDFGASQPAGEVLIYPGGGGTPVAYSDSGMYYYDFPSYDHKGNLYFDGTTADPSDNFVLAELPAAGGSVRTIAVTGATIYVPGSVQWDNFLNGLIVNDQECGGNALEVRSCAYIVSISGSSGTVTTTSDLDNIDSVPVCAVVQTVRIGARAYGSDYEYASGSGFGCASGGVPASQTYRWLFPSGGIPTGTTLSGGVTATEEVPVGAAYSD